MKLEDMQRRLRTAELDLTEGGLNAVSGVLRDLIDVVEALVHREARQVPLPLTHEPFSVWPTPRVNPAIRIASPRQPDLKSMSDDEVMRFFPRGQVVNLYYVRRDYELYQPYPEQPFLLSIRRKGSQR